MIDIISNDIKQAMRDKEKSRLLVLRSVMAELKNAKIELKKELSSEDCLKIIKKAVKAREQAAELYIKGGRQELADNEFAEIEILKNYLPKPISEEDLNKLIDEVIDDLKPQGMKDMGKVMKVVLERTNGNADGKLVSSIVKSKL